MGMFNKIIKKLLYGPKCDSETFIKYLRKNGCKIGEKVHFYSPRTTIVDDVRMDWISIGSYTKITSGVIILAHDYSPSVLLHTHKTMLLAGGGYTTIGSNCFIGMNAIIMPGRHIGNNCIVGAGAVVTSDIPDNSVCAGNPARVIMDLDRFYEKRKEAYVWDAKRNFLHFKQVRGRIPSAGESGGFPSVYLERTEENWNRYFTSYLSHDNDTNDVKAAFFGTKPVFSSYEEFINFCSDEKNNSNSR